MSRLRLKTAWLGSLVRAVKMENAQTPEKCLETAYFREIVAYAA
jgi:hypothetical protein